MMPLCGAQTRTEDKHPCQRIAGKSGKCHLHGGHSTGPRTPEGRERQRIAVTKHGEYSKQALMERRIFRQQMKQYKDELANLAF